MKVRCMITISGQQWSVDVSDLRGNDPAGSPIQWKRFEIYLPSGAWAATISVPDSCDPEAFKSALQAVAASVIIDKPQDVAPPHRAAMN